MTFLRHDLAPRSVSQSLNRPRHAARLSLPSSIRVAAVVGLLPLTALGAQGATTRPAVPPANPDVFLVPLSSTGGTVKVGVPANITRRDGYDNQPSFSADSRAIFFTSNRGDGQSDIYRYDLSTGLAIPARKTIPESEYSAFPTRDAKAITVIRVEADSTQRLWRMPLDTAAPSVMFPDIKPVGYFAQADDSTWALFVLGSPATLQVVHVGVPGGEIVARNIGRSLHRIPGTTRVSYVQKGGTTWYVIMLDPNTKKIDTLTSTLPGSEDMAWVDSTTIVAGNGSKLFSFRRGDSEWKQLADYSFANISSITRLAVSPNKTWLALVGDLKLRTSGMARAVYVDTIPGADPNTAARGARPRPVDSWAAWNLLPPTQQMRSANNGGDDDASGNVALIEMAKALRNGPRPERTILFMAITGEEVGGFGKAWLTGYEPSTMGDLLADNGIPLTPDMRLGQRFFERSDSVAFARIGIPAHSISSFNLATPYHNPKDEASTIAPDHMAQVISATAKAVRLLADGLKPEWHPGGRPEAPAARAPR